MSFNHLRNIIGHATFSHASYYKRVVGVGSSLVGVRKYPSISSSSSLVVLVRKLSIQPEVPPEEVNTNNKVRSSYDSFCCLLSSSLFALCWNEI